MDNIEQEICEEFSMLSDYNILTDRFSYSETKRHFDIKYEDSLPTINGISQSKFIRNDIDFKIDQSLKNGNINWDEIISLYPEIIPRELPKGIIYPKPKFRSKKERQEIETIIIEKWSDTQDYLYSLFPIPLDAELYLKNKRWIKGLICPHCQYNKKFWRLNERKLWKCPKCYRLFSVLHGTIFQNTKMPLIKWYEAIYLHTSIKTRKISTPQLAHALNITQKSAWGMQDKIRSNINTEIIKDIKLDLFAT